MPLRLALLMSYFLKKTKNHFPWGYRKILNYVSMGQWHSLAFVYQSLSVGKNVFMKSKRHSQMPKQGHFAILQINCDSAYHPDYISNHHCGHHEVFGAVWS